MSTACFAPLLRTRVAVLPTTGFQAVRSISATAPYSKGPIDTTKDTLKKADRTVSDAAVKGIDKGGKLSLFSMCPTSFNDTNMHLTEKAAHHLKEAVGAGAQQAKEKSGELKGGAAEYAGKGKGKAEETLGAAKGKAKETMSEAESKAKEAKDRL